MALANSSTVTTLPLPPLTYEQNNILKVNWRRAWQPTPVFLSGESHGQRSLTGYSPWSCTESDMTEVTKHNSLKKEKRKKKPDTKR